MSRRRAIVSPLAAVLLLAALHMLVFDRGLGGDGWATFATLESLAGDGDLLLEDDHRGVMNGLVGAPGGHLVSQYPPGVLALDALPFFIGRALDRKLPAGILADGADLPPAGRVPRGVFLSAALIVLARNAAVLLGLFWTARALRRLGVPDGRAAAAVALAFFGGPLIFYSLVGMTHAPTFALAGLLMLVLVRQREGAPFGPHEPRAKGPFPLLGGGGLEQGEGQDGGGFNEGSALTGAPPPRSSPCPNPPPPRGRKPAPGLHSSQLAPMGCLSFAAGAVLGAAVLVRYSALALLPAALLALAGWRQRLSFLAGFALLLLPLPFWWHAAFGSWLAPPYGGSWHFTFASPWNVLFAPAHGLFLFHPALLFAAAGLFVAAFLEIRRREAGWGATGLVAFLGVAFLHGGWSEWANTGGYGQRFLVDALPFLALGFAVWLAEIRRPVLRWALPLAAALFGYLLFFGAVAGLVPAPSPYPWPQRLGDYAVLLRHPPGPHDVAAGLGRASFVLRPILPR